ncbi:MAG: Tm-1-like ATP-binding domain-containing protein [Candidatus Helarchaeota archaeon]|nr:Tm-1-like ATP-binding domain-containing protein [Candidatus Helarchaeota archaeon]
MKNIVIIGTLDTKGTEIAFLKKQIEKRGFTTTLIDCGILGEPNFKSDITKEIVAKTGGRSIEELQKAAEDGKDRSLTLNVMIKGAEKLVQDLFEKQQIDGMISFGGAQGTAIGITIMKKLPIGIPKLMVTSIMGQSVGMKDISVIQTPDGMIKLNSTMEKALSQAAGAICGMADVEIQKPTTPLPLIGITALGVTTPAVRRIVRLLNEKKYDPIVFHGRTEILNELIEEGRIQGLIDLTPFEIYLLWERRLQSVYKKKIPQIISAGGLDMLIFPGTKEILPKKYKNRPVHAHTSNIVLVRTNKEEISRAAKIIAENANKVYDKTIIAIPLLGFSEIDKKEQQFYDPDTDKTFIETLKFNLKKEIKVIEYNSHINDEEFSMAVVELFIGLFHS